MRIWRLEEGRISGSSLTWGDHQGSVVRLPQPVRSGNGELWSGSTWLRAASTSQSCCIMRSRSGFFAARSLVCVGSSLRL